MDNNRENTYEELIQLKESGEIGQREFIRRQPEMENDYYDWCVDNDLDMNEETAEAFMTLTEEHVMAQWQESVTKIIRITQKEEIVYG